MSALRMAIHAQDPHISHDMWVIRLGRERDPGRLWWFSRLWVEWISGRDMFSSCGVKQTIVCGGHYRDLAREGGG